jgi:hypothetical protein
VLCKALQHIVNAKVKCHAENRYGFRFQQLYESVGIGIVKNIYAFFFYNNMKLILVCEFF